MKLAKTVYPASLVVILFSSYVVANNIKPSKLELKAEEIKKSVKDKTFSSGYDVLNFVNTHFPDLDLRLNEATEITKPELESKDPNNCRTEPRCIKVLSGTRECTPELKPSKCGYGFTPNCTETVQTCKERYLEACTTVKICTE